MKYYAKINADGFVIELYTPHDEFSLTDVVEIREAAYTSAISSGEALTDYKVVDEYLVLDKAKQETTIIKEKIAKVKITAEKKAPIDKALNELKEAHKNKDLAGIDKSMNELNTAWQAASQEMYAASQQAGAQGEQQSQPGGDGGGQEASQKDDEVTDVDFEEVKDDK